MSLLTYNFESEYLNNNHQISVILPDKKRGISPADFYQSNKKYKILWLLHGTFGDNTDWVRKTNIELYAAERNLVVVMPQALNSNYSNWDHMMLGYKMFDYLTEELMPLIYGWFPVSDKREDNYIAGLSMGGRGAVKLAVSHPDKFSAAAVLSAVPVDLKLLKPGHPSMLLDTDNFRLKNTIQNAGGLESYVHSNENVWGMLDQLAALNSLDTLPRLMFACGEEDALLYESYLAFQAHCREIRLDAKWFSLPGYQHEWRFWDKAIQEALEFFDLGDCGGGNAF